MLPRMKKKVKWRWPERQNKTIITGVKPSVRGMNLAERQLLYWIGAKYPNLVGFRHGWPDFFFPFNGTGLAIEVKTMERPKLNRQQVCMFNALQQAGIVGAVWCPSRPGLVGWAKWHRYFSSDKRFGPRIYDPLVSIEEMIKETAEDLEREE